ncbi:MAG TPA: FHA domain-containing protein [Lacipirellulaceae bacterium]|nr:FHA domain-containing protein [Lacipirellulaceae bacterium]
MKLKLVVLAGAKEGLEIPLKKDKFLIGRAKECALRAGSEAISRRHCAIIHRENSWTVRDLGSRNGTYVNDERITKEVPLKDGDELRVGPLKFRVIAEETKEKNATVAEAAPKTTKQRRQPPVKDVGDVVERTIRLSDSATEEDISRWLLDEPGGSDMLKETRSMRAEETSTTLNRVSASGETATVELEDVSKLAGGAAESDTTDLGDDEQGKEAETESGVWKFFKRGKTASKKFGKLPPRPEQQTKDSREAAADILREMTRRR